MRALVRIALRRMTAHATTTVAALLCVFIACLATGTAEVTARATARAIQSRAVASAPVEERTLSVQGSTSAGIDRADAAVRRAAAALPGAQVLRTVTSAGFGVAGAPADVRTEIAHAPAALAASRILTGRAPLGPDEVAVPETAAQALHRRVGDAVQLIPLTASQAPVPALRVVGTYRPVDRAADAWHDDRRHGEGLVRDTFLTAGPLLVADVSTPALRAGTSTAWRIVPATDPAPRSADVTAVVTRLEDDPALRPMAIRTGLTATLARADEDVAQALAGAGPMLLLVAVALVATAVTGSVLAAAHAPGDRLLTTRGAGRGQLGTLAALGALVVLPAAAPAALLAPAVGGLVLSDPQPLVPAPGTCLVVAGTALVAMAVLAACALPRDPAPAVGGHLADLTVLAAAAFAWWRLSTVTSTDAMTVAGPALVVLGPALACVRALPWAARAPRTLAGRSRRLVTTWPGWDLARAVGRDAGVLVLVVATTAAASLAAGQLDAHAEAIRWRARVAAPEPVAVTLADGTQDADRVASRLGGPATAVWRQGATVTETLTTQVVAVDTTHPDALQPEEVVAGPAWPQALRGLRDLGWTPTGGGPTSGGRITTTLRPTTDPGLGELAGYPSLDLLVDDAHGRRHQVALTMRPASTQQQAVYAGDLPRPLPHPLRPVSIALTSGSEVPVTLGPVEEQPTHGGRVVLAPGRDFPLQSLVIPLGQARTGAVPVIVTRALAQAADLHPGAGLTVSLGGQQEFLQVRAIAADLPGRQGSSPYVVLADLMTLQQTALLTTPGRGPLLPDRVWGSAPTTDLRPGPDDVRAVTTWERALDEARREPVPLVLGGVLTMLVVGSAVLAMVGALAGAVKDRTRQRRELAVLAALGLDRRPRQAITRACALLWALPGVLAGTAVALLVGPAVTRHWTYGAQPPDGAWSTTRALATGAVLLAAIGVARLRTSPRAPQPPGPALRTEEP